VFPQAQEFVPSVAIFSDGIPSCYLLNWTHKFDRDGISDADLFNDEVYPLSQQGQSFCYFNPTRAACFSKQHQRSSLCPAMLEEALAKVLPLTSAACSTRFCRSSSQHLRQQCGIACYLLIYIPALAQSHKLCLVRAACSARFSKLAASSSLTTMSNCLIY
jgi:hypothetical protein